MDDPALVISFERALLSRATRTAPHEVERLLDDDFTEIGASGRLWSRGQLMAALAAETGGGDTIDDAEMHAAVLAPDVILLTYVSDPRGRPARRSSLWRRTATGWRLRHHQGTPISDV